MHRSAALRLLAPAHAEILMLADAGIDVASIAEQLSIDPAAVGPALGVARAKLAALEACDEPTNSCTPSPREGVYHRPID